MDINALCLIMGLTPEQTAMIAAILGVLFALSEALALIPSVKSNSVFQLVFNFLKKITGRAVAMLGILTLTAVLLVGCAGNKEIKYLEVEKVVAVETMIASYQANKAGVLKDDDLKKIESAYVKWRTTHIEAVKILDQLRTATDKGKEIKLNALLEELPILLKNLQTIAAAYGIGGAK